MSKSSMGNNMYLKPCTGVDTGVVTIVRLGSFIVRSMNKIVHTSIKYKYICIYLACLVQCQWYFQLSPISYLRFFLRISYIHVNMVKGIVICLWKLFLNITNILNLDHWDNTWQYMISQLINVSNFLLFTTKGVNQF